jgi:hypothetical protein
MGSAPQRLRSVVLTNIEAYDAWPSDEERIYIKLIVHTLTSPVIFALLHSRHVRRRLFAIAAHSGHLPMLEEPDAYADAIIYFAGSAPPPAGEHAPPSAASAADDPALKT